jgi:hypothetical protein
MTDDRRSGLAWISTLIEAIGRWLLIIPSIILGILVVELAYYGFFLSGATRTLDTPMRRVVFLDGSGTIFRNHGDIFTYTPHNDIRSLTTFFSDSDFNVEYDYHFQTNNFGLVQDTDIIPGRESILLLGDSNTEGQGGEPWFRLVSPEITKRGYQAVNGGLMGTGFNQWLKLEEYLAANNIRIRKLLVLFISFDYNRSVWNFKPDDFRCLSALTLCRFEESLFYRLPPQEELSSWIAKIRTSRMIHASRAPTSQRGWLAARAAALLPASYRVYIYFRSGQIERQSRSAITELIRINGADNVAFLHLPQKDELDHGPNDLGLKARQSIQQSGGKLFDGFKLCGLTASDYYTNDEHPDRAGYAKIASCTTGVINEMIGAAR